MTSWWFYSNDIHSGVVMKTRLSEPVSRKTEIVHEFDGITGQNWGLFGDAKICASKFSWLLLSKRNPSNIFYFLYNPFTNNVKTLPILNGLCPNYNDQEATFSGSPTSGNCVFFVCTCIKYNKMGINTNHDGDGDGDGTWRSKVIKGVFKTPVKSLLCTENGDFLYCLFECGKLGIFSTKNQGWNFLVNSPLWSPVRYMRMHLVESDGQVLLAKLYPTNLEYYYHGRHYYYSKDFWKVFRFDEDEKDWIEEESLGDRTLFLGCTSYSRHLVEKLANKIFYHHSKINGWVTRVFSLEDGVEYKKTHVYDWIEQEWLDRVWIDEPNYGNLAKDIHDSV